MATQKKNSKKTLPVESVRTREIVMLALTLLITIVIYSNSLKSDFVIYDDQKYITDNIDIQNLSFENLKLFFTSFYVSMYQPLTILSFAIEFHFSKFNPTTFHTINLIFHLLNILLVFRFIYLLTRKSGLSVFIALFFAIHPMHVESVAWVAERKDVLYTFFFLLSLIFYLKAPEENVSRWKLLGLSFVFFACSLLSKSAAVVLPVLLVLIDYYRKGWRWSLLPEKLPFFALSLLFGIISLYSQENAIEGLSVSYHLYERIFIVCYALSFYVIQFFLPFHMCVLHPYPQKIEGLLPVEYYLSPILITGILYLIYRMSKEFRKEALFGFLFFLITIALVIQLLPVGQAIAAERYTYVPYIGFLFIVGQYYYYLKERKYSLIKKYSSAVFTIIILYAALFSYMAWQRTAVWKTSMTLFDDQIEKYPWHFYGYFSRGNFKVMTKDYQGGLHDYSHSLELRPRNADCYNSRSGAKYYLNDIKGSLADLDSVISINPQYQLAWKNKAVIKGNTGDHKGSIEAWNVLLKMVPEYSYAYYMRGIMQNNIGNTEKACEDFNKAISLGYKDAEKYFQNICVKK